MRMCHVLFFLLLKMIIRKAKYHSESYNLHIFGANLFNTFLDLLVEHGASVNVANSSGYTPLHVAMQVTNMVECRCY